MKKSVLHHGTTRKSPWHAFIFIASLGWIFWGVSCTSQITPTPSTSEELSYYLVIEVTGEVRYKSAGWKNYQPVSMGTLLDFDTLIQSGDNTKLSILCPNITIVQISANYHGGILCPKASTILIRGSSPVLAPRRETTLAEEIPYVISPRHTFIRTPYPHISWAASGDLNKVYTVRVWSQDMDWQIDTTQLYLEYPHEAPQLQPGIAYHLEVKDSHGQSSSQEKTPIDLSFALLSTEKIQEIQQQLEQVDQLDVDGPAASLIEGNILAAHNVQSDAILILSQIVHGNENTPAVALQLGNLYMEVGLYKEAIEAYQVAYTEYQAVQDQAGQATAQLGLGTAYANQSRLVDARNHLEVALDLYKDLHHDKGSRDVETLLKQINGNP